MNAHPRTRKLLILSFITTLLILLQVIVLTLGA